MVTGHPVHAGLGQTGTPKDVAATDYYPDLGTGAAGLVDFPRQALDHRRVDAIVAIAHQGLTGQFQQDAPEFQVVRGYIRLHAGAPYRQTEPL